MKKSNIFLTGLLAFILLVGLCSNLLLKQEFEKIDRKDKFAGYKTTVFQPVRFVRVEGVPRGLTRIQSDKAFKVITKAGKDILTWRTHEDTLVLTYAGHPDVNAKMQGLMFREMPLTYIMIPKVEYIEVKNVQVSIVDLLGRRMQIDQTGGSTRLTGLQIEDLGVDLADNGTMEVDRQNKIDKANVVVKKSGRFTTDHVVKDFRIEADSSTHISLPGAILKKLISH
jgi:hypothetical protein